MKSYKHLQKTLNRLNELITLIRIKEKEISFAQEISNYFTEERITERITKMKEELAELEQEFNDLKRAL